MKAKIKEICTAAIENYGSGHQIEKAKEELFELGAALSHWREGRATAGDVQTEIADVLITATQLAIIFGVDDVTDEMEYKLERLSERMDEAAKKNNPKEYYYGG